MLIVKQGSYYLLDDHITQRLAGHWTYSSQQTFASLQPSGLQPALREKESEFKFRNLKSSV